MRPRERERDPPPPSAESSPTPPRPAINLSSMVVRASDASGGDFSPGELNHRINSPTPPSNPHRRDSPPSDLHRRRGESSPPLRRRRESPVGFHRRDSPPAFRRRGGGGGNRRSQRFHNNRVSKLSGLGARSLVTGIVGACGCLGKDTDIFVGVLDKKQTFLTGHLPRTDSISPPSRRPRLGNSHYDPNFDHPAAPCFGQVFRGGRGGERFRDVSPRNSLGRGGRSFGRGYDVEQRGVSPFEGEYGHRNDPNLSPREGDWICGNPRCGNLNFARRTYCNNCDEPRFATRSGPIRSPRRGYITPPPHGSPPGTGVPIDRGTRRNFNGYRSPPRGWGAVKDPRDFGTVSLPPRRGGRFQDHVRRDNRPEYENECRGRDNWPVDEEWDRRGYDRRPPSPFPCDRWVRERSPIGSRPLKGSYTGCGRDDRRYDDRGRADDSKMGRGRGFRRTQDSFIGRGRGDKNNGDMY